VGDAQTEVLQVGHPEVVSLSQDFEELKKNITGSQIEQFMTKPQIGTEVQHVQGRNLAGPIMKPDEERERKPAPARVAEENNTILVSFPDFSCWQTLMASRPTKPFPS
jgi:hypothetical protein